MDTVAKSRAEELVEFLEDGEGAGASPSARSWKVLVVDDDPEVHGATVFALSEAFVCGRRLELIHAYSAKEARELLGHVRDVAVILLDVVMEGHDSGLDLVRVIRKDLGLADVRIILRTGQPGYAPELGIIRDYDINDYRTKAELTHSRLITALTAAVRSYEQICNLSVSRRGLEVLAETGSQIFIPRNVRAFAEVALSQLEALIGGPLDAVFCGPLDRGGVPGDQEEMGVLAVTGAYRG